MRMLRFLWAVNKPTELGPTGCANPMIQMGAALIEIYTGTNGRRGPVEGPLRLICLERHTNHTMSSIIPLYDTFCWQ